MSRQRSSESSSGRRLWPAGLAAGIALLAACAGGSSSPSGVLPARPAAQAPVVFAGPFGTEPRGPRIRLNVLHAGKPHIFHSRTWYKRHRRLALRRMSQPGDGSNLPYNGGPVQVNPVIYVIFWGISSSSDTTHDPDGMASYLTNFFSAIPGSLWLNTDTQYSESAPNYATAFIGNGPGQFGGVFYDPSEPPSTFTQSDVQNEALKAEADHFGYLHDANYIVVAAHGATINGFGTQFCGWHTSATTSNGLFSYTLLPYMPDAGSACGARAVKDTLINGAEARFSAHPH
jgi:hypothetical protein